MTDIFARYPEFRDKPRALAMLCALLRDRGHFADALAVGEAAIAAAPDDLALQTDVRATLSGRIAGFHGPILLDRARNAAYARAIEAMVRPGMLVLEIGAGSGLLALLAARAGATVVACEQDPLIAATAQEIVARNGFADRVTIVSKRSDRMTIPDDLPRPADLVLHEIFGSQLVDEGVTGALADARRRLLSPGAPSLPPAAEIRVALVADARSAPVDTLADVHGFDLSPFELLVRPIRSVGANERRGLERRSPPVSALAMNYDAPPPFGVAAETIELVSQGGRIDGVVQWIAIRFADGAVLENDPFADGPASSWAAACQTLATPIDTRPGDRITVTLRHRGTVLTIDAVRPADG